MPLVECAFFSAHCLAHYLAKKSFLSDHKLALLGLSGSVHGLSSIMCSPWIHVARNGNRSENALVALLCAKAAAPIADCRAHQWPRLEDPGSLGLQAWLLKIRDPAGPFGPAPRNCRGTAWRKRISRKRAPEEFIVAPVGEAVGGKDQLARRHGR